MAATVPGSAGWAVSGDKTYEFARSPLEFLQKRVCQHGSKIFLSRALNKPIIFVTSSKGVKEILTDKAASFSMGYKDFGYIYDLYSDVLLFYDGHEAARLKGIIQRLFDHENCSIYFAHVKFLGSEMLSELNLCASVPLYETFKEYTTALCLSMFLNINWKSPEYETVKAISILHWHGLISVPVNLKVKGWSTSYSKAIEAKEYLLTAIKRKLNSTESKTSFVDAVKDAGFISVEEAAKHLMLFVSALIPKALASLLTSFCIAMAGEKRVTMRKRALEDDSYLDKVILEVQRLWPPFLGGRRLTKEAVIIDGFEFPEGVAVGYISWLANRDPEVFGNPETFMPERWESDSPEKEFVWTFGGGPRKCVGLRFINHILKITCKKLLRDYDWMIKHEGCICYKTLPVARPKQTVESVFTLKSPIGF